MIEKAKANSNGTTPIHEVPNFFSIYQPTSHNKQKVNPNSYCLNKTPLSTGSNNEMNFNKEIQTLSSSIHNDTNEKKYMSFISPTNFSQQSTNLMDPNKKRNFKHILGGPNIFDTKNLESPSRQ